MVPVSNDFKNAMKRPIKELQAYITGENLDVRDDTDLEEIKISVESNLCKTAMRKAEIKLLGSYNLLGKWIHVGFGVRLENNNFEYLDYGSFLVTEQTIVSDTEETTLIAYDKMINAMTKYTPSNVVYPITLYNYTSQLCQAIGLQLENESFLVHNNWLIQKELWENIEGITYRDILEQIAQVTCTTAIIRNNDKIYFKPLTDTNEELTYDNLFKLKLEPLYGEINSVVLSRTPQEDNVYMKDDASIQTNGLTEWKIENNEIIDKNRDEAITPIYQAMHGINYYPFEAETEGLGWYEVGDNIDIVNDTEDVFNTSLFNFSITIDGGIKETLKTKAENKTQTQYQYASTIEKRLTNTEIIVDKQEGKIDEIVSDIQDLTDFLKTIEGDEEITLENTVDSNGAIGRLEITGITEMPLYPGMAYPSNNVYPGKLTTYIIIQENEDGTEYNETYIDLGMPLIATDKLIIDNNKVSVQRINGNISTDLKVVLKTFEGQTKIRVKFFDDVNIKCNYIEKNDFTRYFATETELSSQFLITDEGIKSKVSKAEIISEINQSAEAITINADKISLAGKELNLTSDNISIKSNNFSLTPDGLIKSKAGEIGGFNINENFNNSFFGIYKYSNYDLCLTQAHILNTVSLDSTAFQVLDANDDGRISSIDLLKIDKIIKGLEENTKEASGNVYINSNDPKNALTIDDKNGNHVVQIGITGMNATNGVFKNIVCMDMENFSTSNQTGVFINGTNGTIRATGGVTNGSLEKIKKNFEKFDNALDIIKNTDIYKFNYKQEADDYKKHIGFVIGDKFKYSKEITTNENDGVDLYSFISVCCKAIQEQQEEIEKLKSEINLLKKGSEK